MVLVQQKMAEQWAVANGGVHLLAYAPEALRNWGAMIQAPPPIPCLVLESVLLLVSGIDTGNV